MNAGLQYPRIVIVKSTSFLANTLGMRRFVPWFMSRKDGVKFLMEKLEAAESGTYLWQTTVDGYEIELLTGLGAPLCKLKMDRHGPNGLRLTELTFYFEEKWDRRTRRRLASQLDPFGWNVSAAVLEAYDAFQSGSPEHLKKQKYVASVELTPGQPGLVRFIGPSVFLGETMVPTKLGWIAIAASCSRLVSWYSGFLGF